MSEKLQKCWRALATALAVKSNPLLKRDVSALTVKSPRLAIVLKSSGLKIRIDGHLISVKESAEQICRVLAYYKPEGELCTRNDPEGRPTVLIAYRNCAARGGLR